MIGELNDIAKVKHAYIETDRNGFRRAARTLQSIWRERMGLPIGSHNGKPLGSRLPEELAKTELANYLTPIIKTVVKEALATAQDGQVFQKPRIYNDLLSSQPLCFNLFGELKLDLGLATEALKMLHSEKIKEVTKIGFEYSPGRSSTRFTDDRSAFDAFVEYRLRDGGQGFIGIEVKYHENLEDEPAKHRERYDDVATEMACFKPEAMPMLRKKPLQQLWRDHLLAGSMLNDDKLNYAEGAFVVVFPAANPYCRAAIKSYRECLSDTSTFDAWTLEEVIGVLSISTCAPWVDHFYDRYLNFGLICDSRSQRCTSIMKLK